jgi:RES domain
VSKLPAPPGVAALCAIPPQTLILPADTSLARIYFAAGGHPLRWARFRSFGPVDARWDHHLPDSRGGGVEQSRAVLYCALDIDTCVAEVFQATRRIDRARGAPWLVVFALREPVTLLDLRGTFATMIGASTAIHSGPRSRTRTRARAWARELYEAYPNVQGVHYGSSMTVTLLPWR